MSAENESYFPSKPLDHQGITRLEFAAVEIAKAMIAKKSNVSPTEIAETSAHIAKHLVSQLNQHQ